MSSILTREDFRTRTASVAPKEEIAQIGFQIANDLIAFDFHFMYACNARNHRGESVWRFSDGYLKGEQLEEELVRARHVDNELIAEVLDGTAAFQCITLKDHIICAASLSLPHGERGLLAVGRECKSSTFTETERQHFQSVARMMQASFSNVQHFALLKRLHLCFLDNRTLLRQLQPDEVLSAYLRKAINLCHPGVAEAKGQNWRVRCCATLPTPNDMALRVVACSSSDSQETKQHENCSLISASSDASITARVFQARTPIWTNSLSSTDESPFHRFLSLARCHMSVPVVTVSNSCLGVMSIETDMANAYDENTERAFALLAAHSAWPLAHALNQDRLTQQISETTCATFAIKKLKNQSSEDGIFGVLTSALASLGYHRGLVCRVDNERGTLTGFRSWGDELMQEVSRITSREIRVDSSDCQVLAVTQKRPVIISAPETDSRVSLQDVKLARLKPFAVFPLLDDHDRVLWTVHVERCDTAPLGTVDVDRVHQLCTAAIESWDDCRRDRIERDWAELVLSAQFVTLEQVLRQFADFVTLKEIARRCRIYVIDSVKRLQTGLYQSGVGIGSEFLDTRLDDRAIPVLKTLQQKMRPVLVLKGGAKTQLRGGDEFDLQGLSDDPHEILSDDGLSQWVEVPVVRRGMVVAKAVLDHKDAAADAFSLNELRLIARLGRMLSLATEAVEAAQARTHLCGIGLNQSLLFHHLFRSCDQLHYALNQESRDTLEGRLHQMKESLVLFEELFRHRSATRTCLTIGEELEFALQVIKSHLCPWADVRTPDRDCAELKWPVLSVGRPLLLILLTLLQNANAAARSLNGSKTVAIEIELSKTLEPREQVKILIKNEGRPITDEIASNIRERVQRPVKFLASGNGSGLVYAGLLAKEMGWNLKLLRTSSPTTFEISVAVPNGGSCDE